MSDRFDRAIVGSDLRRREPGSRRDRDGGARRVLVRRDDRLLLLLTPPFDQAAPDPGYIKGYPPGIRENGGQYTHGAIWSVIAFAMLGEGDKAGELFSILNPINHASTRAGIHRYKVEPYVACGDYIRARACRARGWTWYTGSAGWMYRAGLEWILGFRLRGATLLSIPACRKPGDTSKSSSATTPRATTSRSRILTASVAVLPASNSTAIAAGKSAADPLVG